MPCTRFSQPWPLVITAWIASGAALAGELRPLPTPPNLPAQSPTVDQRNELERYYQAFTLHARPLNTAQRAQLTRDFEALRLTAEKAGRPAEAAHYARLIAILVQTTP